jgi:hypothetical protein
MKVLLVLLAAGVLAATAAAAGPRVKHTSAGEKLASASLLKLVDLGQGWTAAPSTTSDGVHLGCTGFQPRQNDLVEVGAADSPTFSGGRVGPFVVQKSTVFATAAQATRLWKRAVKSRLADCVARDLQSSLASQGVNVDVASKRMLPFAKVAPRRAYYRVIATLVSNQQRLRLYFDVLVLSYGRTVTTIAISQFQSAPTAKAEEALARLVARRLGVTNTA